MAGAGEKTEKPTPRRIQEARKKGQVAKSVDLNSAVILGAIALMLFVYGPVLLQYLARLLRDYLTQYLKAGDPIDAGLFQGMFAATIGHVITILAPFIVGVMIFGLIANLAQVKPMFSPEAIKPKLDKLNPINGFKRLFSQRSLVELGKGILKMTIVGCVGLAIVYLNREHLFSLSQLGFTQAWMLLFKMILYIAMANFVILALLGAADFWYQRYQLMKQLRMTKQEVKDELKNTEGNPEIKRKIKQSAHQMLNATMLKNVPKADVVVNNPTHISVAIQYDPDESPAPRVVAKGADYMAFKIREIAQENGIPMVENKPLARTLYKMVEVEHMVPPDLFVAVAEVLAYVFKLNKGRKRREQHNRWMNRGGVAR